MGASERRRRYRRDGSAPAVVEGRERERKDAQERERAAVQRVMEGEQEERGD